MLRFLMNFATQLVLVAVALLVAAWLVDGVELRVGGFLVGVLVFAVAQAIIGPFVFNMARKYASAMLGGIGLVSTFLALWVATLFNGGLSVHGAKAWVLAPLVIWIITAVGTWIVGALFIEKWFARREEERIAARAARRK